MISGKITSQESGSYGLTLSNGQSLRLEAKYLPQSLCQVGKRINLIFGGVEASGIEPEEARSLLNSLLSLG